MNNSDITDLLFREAVEAIDSGNTSRLKKLLEKDTGLVDRRLDVPEEGYFRHPYLLWFVADNPIRHDRLPPNIGEITGLLIETVRAHAQETFQEQIDYTLGLVATGRVPRECGVQIELMDLLIDAGARPGKGYGALAHGNVEAARHLIERGGRLTLTTAVCLELRDELERLASQANSDDLQLALMAAAFYGKSDMIRYLLDLGAQVNGYIDSSSGFHYHATALHQAVSSGSLESVKLLVEHGASLDAEDRKYHGTPLGWARHMQTEQISDTQRKQYAEIEAFLSKGTGGNGRQL